MNPDSRRRIAAVDARWPAVELSKWWTVYGAKILGALTILMAILAAQRLAYEFWRLVWSAERNGAIDLKIFHKLAHGWFRSDYAQFANATYPPASHVIFWPFLGWLEVTPARWLWAAITVATLVWLSCLVVRESGASTRLERVFLVLTLLSSYATAITIGNGQLILLVLSALLMAVLLLAHGWAGWRIDLSITLFFLIALVKPSLTIPFCWLVLFVPGRLRPALLIAAGYIGLALFAAAYQPVGIGELMRSWFERSSFMGANRGYANVHMWLAGLGLERWMGLASAAVLGALGWWTYRHRHMDIWILLGVTALVARLWTYHALYDDLLIVLPLVTLYRMAQGDRWAGHADVAAGVMFAILFLAMLIPARLHSWPAPWNWPFNIGHPIVWLATLLFLLAKARRPEPSLVR